MTKKVTTADFIRRGRETHGDTYDYSKSVYVAAKVNVTMISRICILASSAAPRESLHRAWVP